LQSLIVPGAFVHEADVLEEEGPVISLGGKLVEDADAGSENQLSLRRIVQYRSLDIKARSDMVFPMPPLNRNDRVEDCYRCVWLYLDIAAVRLGTCECEVL
jgi:hypothetical protein